MTAKSPEEAELGVPNDDMIESIQSDRKSHRAITREIGVGRPAHWRQIKDGWKSRSLLGFSVNPFLKLRE
jgi:hypothetical protein